MLIQPLTANMNITKATYECRWENPFVDLVQKVAIATVLPIALIAFTESVVKNLIFINLANCGITLINEAYSFISHLPEYA